MSNSYLGFRKEVLTFTSVTGLEKGYATTISDTGVIAVPDGLDFIGIVDSVRGTIAGVQMEGYVECRYSGTAPTLGICMLGGGAVGSVKVSTTAKKYYRVLKVDTAKHIIGFIL